MLRGVFFDLDDTLIASEAAERQIFGQGWRETFGDRNVEEKALRRAFHLAYQSLFAYGTPGYAELAHLALPELNRRLAAAALARLELTDPEAVERFVQTCEAAEQRLLAPFPDTFVTLRALRDAGLKIGLITNGPSAMQRYKLSLLALTDYFDALVIDTEFGHPKPDRRIFDHAAAAVGLSPSELLFLGNSLEHDVAGARRADWLAVWYNPAQALLPSETEPPHYTIATLTELLTLPPIITTLTPT